MHATIRRYEGVDQNRTTELTGKITETLVPELSKLPGFKGFYLIDAADGVVSSLVLFETREQGEESSRLAAGWVREQELEAALPNAPRITSGEVVAHEAAVKVSF